MNKPARPSPAATSADRDALVREAAYALYVQQGCISGHELEHWLAAEALVDESLKQATARPRRVRVLGQATSGRARSERKAQAPLPEG